jgi:hypothetical protein
LGYVPQNASPSSEAPSFPLLLQAPAQDREMSIQRADLRPFAPPGFHHQDVQHRPALARAVMHPAPKIHEDYAIVSIEPLPNHLLQFPAVHEVVEEFLVQHMRVGIRDIQPTHLGQALVRFENLFNRDLLIGNSPHPYGGVNFSVVRHNAARNSRAIQFNQECRLILMGFPLDY